MPRFQRIDELLISDHFYLRIDDECYFLVEYTSGKRYDYSSANSLISNLKKKPSTRGTAQWPHKIRVMRDCSRALGAVLNPEWLREATLVPIPPSKEQADPEHDVRMRTICESIPVDFQIDVRDLVIQTDSYDAAHESGYRPTVEELVEIYEINETVSEPAPRAIGIVDDVLTAGAHYRAMHNVISGRFPDVPIIGIFIARRVFPPDEAAADFDAVEGYD